MVQYQAVDVLPPVSVLEGGYVSGALRNSIESYLYSVRATRVSKTLV